MGPTIPSESLPFELPNGGAGPDTLALSAIDAEFAVMCFQRDHNCGDGRAQVRSIAARYDEFRARNAEVVVILPSSIEHAVEWADRDGLPFPVLADEHSRVAARYGQPVRFGLLGRLHNLIGRMPETVLVDLRSNPQAVYAYIGEAPSDRPSIDVLLLQIDRARGAV
ncbi:MAG: redoxin domain-containing protein [Halobacteriota archaeon]